MSFATFSVPPCRRLEINYKHWHYTGDNDLFSTILRIWVYYSTLRLLNMAWWFGDLLICLTWHHGRVLHHMFSVTLRTWTFYAYFTIFTALAASDYQTRTRIIYRWPWFRLVDIRYHTIIVYSSDFYLLCNHIVPCITVPILLFGLR